MKTLRCFCLTLLVSLFSLTLFSQNTLFAVVDYMRVPEGGTTEYLEVEQKIWKPMHQEWVNQGKVVGWYLYRVPYPGGTDAEYHFATVRIYENMAQLEAPMSNMDAVFKKVHAGKDSQEIGKRTMASRDLIKSYGFRRWANFGDPKLTEPPKILQIVKFNVSMDKWDSYQEMEKKYYHPTHKAEVEAGTRAGWAGWQLMRPMSTTGEYQFVAVDAFKDWKQYTTPNPKGLFEKVFSGNELELRGDLFMDVINGMSLEEWHLVDYVERPPSTTTSSNN